MSLLPFLAPVPPDEPLVKRLGVWIACLAYGAWMIHVGRGVLRGRSGQPSARLGRSTLSGGQAAFVGWLRIGLGLVVIALGCAYLVFGAFFAR